MKKVLAVALALMAAIGCERNIAPLPAANQALDGMWIYGSTTSEMDDSISTFASLYSVERLPDGGGRERTFVNLSIGGTNSVVFRLEGSSFNCSGGYLLWPEGSVSDPDTCSVRFRFDDSPPLTFGAREYGDSGQYLGVEDEEKFLEEMKRARVLRAELPVFGIGSTVVVFDVAGFDPQQMAVGGVSNAP